MFDRLRKAYAKSRLKNQSYAFLFDEPPSDEWVAFDCETTGLNPKTAELLSIGAVKIKANRVLTSESLHLFVKPSKPVGEESIKIHHIRNEDLKDALEPKEAVDKFLRFLGPRRAVGYYIEFDVAIIDKYLKEMASTALPNEKVEVSSLYFDKKHTVFSHKTPDLRFESIIKELELPTTARHSAVLDAIMTALIFVKLKAS